jgi:hypothetical protein
MGLYLMGKNKDIRVYNFWFDDKRYNRCLTKVSSTKTKAVHKQVEAHTGVGTEHLRVLSNAEAVRLLACYHQHPHRPGGLYKWR